MSVTCVTTRGQADAHGLDCHLSLYDIQACAATEDHVWVYGPTTVRVCVDVWSLCYQKRAMRMTVDGSMVWTATLGHVMSKGYAELVLPLTDPGRAGLAICWLLQLETWP